MSIFFSEKLAWQKEYALRFIVLKSLETMDKVEQILSKIFIKPDNVTSQIVHTAHAGHTETMGHAGHPVSIGPATPAPTVDHSGRPVSIGHATHAPTTDQAVHPQSTSHAGQAPQVIQVKNDGKQVKVNGNSVVYV